MWADYCSILWLEDGSRISYNSLIMALTAVFQRFGKGYKIGVYAVHGSGKATNKTIGYVGNVDTVGVTSTLTY